MTVSGERIRKNGGGDMPHVIVKLWPGRTEEQKKQLAEKIAQDVVNVLKCEEQWVSVGFEEVKSDDWAEKVYQPEIVSRPDSIYKKPGYTM
jgi:4-oxalocrotonate tautomerase